MKGGRYLRLNVIDPAGFEVVMKDGVSVKKQHNADAQAPITIAVLTQCPCCLGWSELSRLTVPNWSSQVCGE